MITSNIIKVLTPLFEIITKSKGKTIGMIKQELDLHDKSMKKGAAGMIVENLLGLKNNNRPEADMAEIGCEIKVLPIQKNRNGEIKAKEPTAIQQINYCQVANEVWETASIRKKISLTFWVVYLAKENSRSLAQDDYVIVDFFLDHPADSESNIFRNDWEAIQKYINLGKADQLSCSMGEYIEPKTKGKNSNDLTDAPDGNGGLIKARRRAFYFKKNYTNKLIIPKIDTSSI